jgi:hypothetical protein
MYTLPYDATTSTIFFSRYVETNKDFVVSFDFACYGPNLSGSEGFCVYFTNTQRPYIQYGGPGPGLGYCPVSGVKANTDIAEFWGMAGGLLGIGFDLTGNFGSNAFFDSGLDFANSNTITLRGSGSSDYRTGYNFITQTKNINTGYYDTPISLYQQVNNGQEPIYKRVRIRVTDYGRRLIVDLKSPSDLFFTNYLDYDISSTVLWPTSIRCGLSFSTGLHTDTIFKIKGFNINGSFTTQAATSNFETYQYYLDSATLSGSTMDYVKVAFEINDVLRVVNAGTTLPAVTAAAPLITVNPINGPDGAPYDTANDYIIIDPNPFGRPDPRKK